MESKKKALGHLETALWERIGQIEELPSGAIVFPDPEEEPAITKEAQIRDLFAQQDRS